MCSRDSITLVKCGRRWCRGEDAQASCNHTAWSGTMPTPVSEIGIVTSKNCYFRHGRTSNVRITQVRGLGHARGKPDGLNGLRANRTKLTSRCKYEFETSQMSWELLSVLGGERRGRRNGN